MLNSMTNQTLDVQGVVAPQTTVYLPVVGVTAVNEVKKYINDEISKVLSLVFEFKGIINKLDLTSDKLSEEHVNDVWQIKESFVTDDRFVEGAHLTVNANELITVIKQDGMYKFNVLGSAIDLTGFFSKVNVVRLI